MVESKTLEDREAEGEQRDDGQKRRIDQAHCPEIQLAGDGVPDKRIDVAANQEQDATGAAGQGRGWIPENLLHALAGDIIHLWIPDSLSVGKALQN